MSSDEEKPTTNFEFSKAELDHFENKTFSKHYDPCKEVAEKSINCLRRNPGDKDLCNDYFQAYRDCKKAWTEALKQRRKEKGGWSVF